MHKKEKRWFFPAKRSWSHSPENPPSLLPMAFGPREMRSSEPDPLEKPARARVSLFTTLAIYAELQDKHHMSPISGPSPALCSPPPPSLHAMSSEGQAWASSWAKGG